MTASTRSLVAVATFILVVQLGAHDLGQVQCTSYLDDYFLPTAKIALNKIQQSLSPSSFDGNKPSPNLPTNTGSFNNNQTATTIVESGASATSSELPPTSSAGPSSTNQQQSESDNRRVEEEPPPPPATPPNGAEFTKIETPIPSPPTLADRPASNQLAPQLNNESSVTGNSLQAAPGESRQSGPIARSEGPEQPLIPLTSTDSATDSDPTSTVPSAELPVERRTTDNNENIKSADTNSGDSRKQPASDTTTQPETSTLTTTTTTAAAAASGHQVEQTQQPTVAVAEGKSAADEAAIIRETELEAVAAVDASIGFGDIFGSLSDSCYDEYANARFCEPEFENIAFERQVEVSSECGTPPSRFCTTYLNERHEQIRNCHICDAQHPKKRHPAAYLTDMNNSNSPTCWVSAPINAAASSSAAATNATTSTNESPMMQTSTRSDNVTLVLNFDKKYEIVYISMQFCSMKPDSLAIYKSMDFGRSWSPYQFYSSQCRRMYGRQSAGNRAGSVGTGSRAPTLELEATCANSSAQQSSSSSSLSGRIAFSTLDGRNAGGSTAGTNPATNLERSQLLQDWITATNIKIVLDRHQASWIHSNLVHPHAHQLHTNHHLLQQRQQQQQHQSRNEAQPKNASEPNEAVPGLQASANNQQTPITHELMENSLTSPSDTFNYAMSDLTVGGRCKCNGHASRCIHSKEGRLQCDCRHNTAGRDCEKCAPFHFDRPWARATQLDANPCQPCNCNGHSRKCRFDAELYRMSGKRSGGVCIGCRDNTAGRFCNYCKEGFTRDHSKPMSDKEACKHCDCHPIGSLGRACNQTTGQCPCKEGVSGLQCNRCAPGYQQSSSLTDPCIKLPDNENDINYYPPPAVDGDDERSTTNEQQPNPTPILETASDQLDETSPPPPVVGGPTRASKNNNNNNNKQDSPQIEPDPSDSQLGDLGPHSQQDKDNDDDTSDPVEMEQATFARKPAGRQHWPGQQHRNSRNKANTYYGYHPVPYRTTHQQPQQFESPLSGGNDDDDDQESSDEMDDLVARRTTRPSAAADEDYLNGGRGYYYPNVFSKSRYAPTDYRQRRIIHTNGRHRTDLMLQPVASIEHGVDEINSLDDATNYAPPPSTVYSNSNEDNFNQIQTPTNLRRPAGMQPQRSRGQLAGGRARGGQFGASVEQQSTMAVVGSHPNEVVCGDCQSSTRRLSSRQFCHLQFAIRATILNRYMADDWTKFEVEIQDIFKSQGGSPPASSNSRLDGAGGLVVNSNGAIENQNMVQADEPIHLARENANATSTEGDHQAPYVTHRIKVGTIQSIWVPTEDLTCKCPRLKLRSTYLLMGSIDAKENSANALQLDRHGIALEWKSNLQEKLLKYQRRLSRGKC